MEETKKSKVETKKVDQKATKVADAPKAKSTKDNTVVLKITNLNKFYGEKHVLKDINFEIRQGEKVSLVGANGAGKSTLSEIIAQLREQTSGTIEYSFGTHHKEIVKQIGIQFQENVYPSGYRVKHLIDFYLEVSDSDQEIGSSEELIKRFHLTGLENRELKSLSGGQKQRLNVLLALINSPKLVILDEISTGLDVESQNDIKGFVKDYLAKSGATLILVSHHMEEIEYLTDRVIALGAGKVKYDLPIKEIQAKYKDMSSFINKFFDEARVGFEARTKAEAEKMVAEKDRRTKHAEVRDASNKKHGAYNTLLKAMKKESKSFDPKAFEAFEKASLSRKEATNVSIQLRKLDENIVKLNKNHIKFVKFENEAKVVKFEELLKAAKANQQVLKGEKGKAYTIADADIEEALKLVALSNSDESATKATPNWNAMLQSKYPRIYSANERVNESIEIEKKLKDEYEKIKDRLDKANSDVKYAIDVELAPGTLFDKPISWAPAPKAPVRLVAEAAKETGTTKKVATAPKATKPAAAKSSVAKKPATAKPAAKK